MREGEGGREGASCVFPANFECRVELREREMRKRERWRGGVEVLKYVWKLFDGSNQPRLFFFICLC